MVDIKQLTDIILDHWQTEDDASVAALVADLEGFINDFVADQVWHATVGYE